MNEVSEAYTGCSLAIWSSMKQTSPEELKKERTFRTTLYLKQTEGNKVIFQSLVPHQYPKFVDISCLLLPTLPILAISHIDQTNRQPTVRQPTNTERQINHPSSDPKTIKWSNPTKPAICSVADSTPLNI